MPYQHRPLPGVPTNSFAEGHPTLTSAKNVNPGAMPSIHADKDTQMRYFFGHPVKEQKKDPYGLHSEESRAFHDAWTGQNLSYMTIIMISGILMHEQWPVTKLLPWKEKTDGTEVVIWDVN